jgi:hypothetical protein
VAVGTHAGGGWFCRRPRVACDDGELGQGRDGFCWGAGWLGGCGWANLLCVAVLVPCDVELPWCATAVVELECVRSPLVQKIVYRHWVVETVCFNVQLRSSIAWILRREKKSASLFLTAVVNMFFLIMRSFNVHTDLLLIQDLPFLLAIFSVLGRHIGCMFVNIVPILCGYYVQHSNLCIMHTHSKCSTRIIVCTET